MPETDIWLHFRNSALRVIHFAQEEAKRMGVSVVGTEHLLLGLLREHECVAVYVLERQGVSLDAMRSEIIREFGHLKASLTGSPRLTLSPRAKTALENALLEAQELNPKLGLPELIDTEQFLLGLIHAGAGSGSHAVHLLEAQGISLERIRAELLACLGVN